MIKIDAIYLKIECKILKNLFENWKILNLENNKSFIKINC